MSGKGKKKGVVSLVIGIVVLLCGLFIGALCFPPFSEMAALASVRSYLVANAALTTGPYALLAPGIMVFVLGVMLLVFRGRRPTSNILVPYLVVVYYTLLGVIHYRNGIATPEFLMSNIIGRWRVMSLVVAFILEIVLLMLLIIITSAIDKKIMESLSARNVRRSHEEEKPEESEDNDEKSLLKEEKRKAKEEARRMRKEEKEAQKLARRQAKEARRNTDSSRHVPDRDEEEVVVKVNASAKATVQLDPDSPIVFPEVSTRLPSDPVFASADDAEAEPEPVKSVSESVQKEVVIPPSVFETVKEEEKREKIDLSKPQTFKKGGLLESTIEAITREQQQAKTQPRQTPLPQTPVRNAERNLNQGPIIGYDGPKGSNSSSEKSAETRKNDSSFAPSNLSPDHPRYKLFESLRRKNPPQPAQSQGEGVTHFPSRPFSPSQSETRSSSITLKSGVPETLSEAIDMNESRASEPQPVIEPKPSYTAEPAAAPAAPSADDRYRTLLEEREAEIKALEEKQRRLEEKTHELEEMMQHKAAAPSFSMPEAPKRYADVEVKSEDHELSRSSSYYQGESTAKAVNGAVIEDPKKVEVEPTGSDLIEFRAGVGGLASNNAGEAAIIDRAKRGYNPPPMDFLKEYPQTSYEIDDQTRAIGESIVSLLDEFRIEVTLKDIVKGPVITLFEFDLAPGIMINKVLSLRDNIAMRLGGKTIRLLAPVPGRGSIGVEVPNPVRATVGFKELIGPLKASGLKVPMILGRDITGNPTMLDVAKTPHLLIAGTTGSGKSVCINGLIASIIYTKSPKEVRLLMIDPKIVELQVYNGIPHLLTPVITEPKKVLKILDWLVEEMERRYHMFAQVGVRNIDGFNSRIHEMGYATEKMPYIVLIMDEFADLMTVIGKDIESYVSRLMAKSRAAGIHVVMATQRPSSEVVTGTIKSNIPSRISFAVSSGMNSRIILDQLGAEDLLGKGDMLYLNPSASEPSRIQGAFLSDEEVEEIAAYIKKQGEPDYLDESIFEDEPEPEESFDSEGMGGSDGDLYEQAKQIVFERKGASASYLQRRLSIGYNKAAKLVEQMEDEGIVGPANGSKPREILKYE